MTDKSSQLEPTPSGFSEAPSSQSAADDLRAAAGESAKQIASSAEERAQQLKEAASKKAQQFRDYAGEKAEQVRDVAGDRAQHVKEAATVQWEDTRVRFQEVHTELEEYVRQHPTKSILTAAGVGLIMGLILRR